MSSIEERATRKTLAKAQASLRLSSAIDVVAERLLAAQQGEGDGPTEAQLEALRRRHLEYEALDRAQRETWELARESPYEGIVSSISKYVYRLTLFTAACVVLWRWLAGA